MKHNLCIRRYRYFLSVTSFINLLVTLLQCNRLSLALQFQSKANPSFFYTGSRTITRPNLKNNLFTSLYSKESSSPSSLNSSNGNTIHGKEKESQDDEVLIPRKTPWFKLSEDNRIYRRIDLNELQVGRKLKGIKLEHECLLGETGPKVFLDCGVARYIAKRNVWTRVNGMLRIGTKREKASIHRKRAAKLAKKGLIDVYVSRVFTENGRLEVSLDPIILAKENQNKKKIPISTLQPKQELVGIVTRVEPYGVLVDVGANRHGLLHIQRVADLNSRYINKVNGLEKAGLEKGAKIRVQVVDNQKKRLFLDFTDDVKKEAELLQQIKNDEEEEEEEEVQEQSSSPYLSEDEAAKWAAFASADNYDNYPQQEEDYGYDDDAAAWEEFSMKGKDDDEDRKIEDSLGLGSY